jgi:hypothetical protein
MPPGINGEDVFELDESHEGTFENLGIWEFGYLDIW